MKDENAQQWQRYYKKGSGRPAREFLRVTIRYFQTTGNAIDLGCGTGSSTLFLLRNGWEVLAIDQQPNAIEHLAANLPAQFTDQLQTQIAAFESTELPSTDLIWAGRSLPFCHPDHFATFWGKICAALRSGGRFAGDFFGNRHAWHDNPNMTFHTREQLLTLCEPLHLEYIEEGEGEQLTALGGVQHWHRLTIRARKP